MRISDTATSMLSPTNGLLADLYVYQTVREFQENSKRLSAVDRGSILCSAVDAQYAALIQYFLENSPEIDTLYLLLAIEKILNQKDAKTALKLLDVYQKQLTLSDYTHLHSIAQKGNFPSVIAAIDLKLAELAIDNKGYAGALISQEIRLLKRYYPQL